jgi:hypothetical protein
MDAENLDDLGIEVPYLDEDSGSVYEEPSDVDRNSDEELQISRVSRASSQRHQTRSRSRSVKNRSRDEEDSLHGSAASSQIDQKTRDDALQWAANFQPPQSPGDIKSPTRRAAGTQSKRKAEEKPASEARAKRLKKFYNNDYRELLNIEIHDAVARTVLADYTPLPESQIGSSIWTSEEKDIFFSALSRLGRNDVRGIALRIGSKSELEVQEYIQVLHQGMKEKDDIRKNPLSYADLPAAFEISGECCGLLERAGEALASRQECSEEKKEKNKWGNSWLLTTYLSREIEHQRKENGEESIEETLPAANLLNLKNWLELSHRIFMNPGEPREEDNWQALAEPGETPAIRATAFGDFHSLAVSITKRLISTTLFCTMSRQRATSSRKFKRAEVNTDDVEAAVKILGLKSDSHEFWVGCARRSHLNVFDDGENSGDEADMTYDEVENALRQEIPRRSRSRSLSRPRRLSRASVSSVDIGTTRDDSTDSQSEGLETDHAPLPSQESDVMSNFSLEDEEFMDLSDDEIIPHNPRLKEARERKIEEIKEFMRAQEVYEEAFDEQADQMEEQRLRKLLGQTTPFDVKPEPLEVPARPKHSRNQIEEVDWKDSVEYWSPWETLPTPVPEESFAANAKRRSRRARMGIREKSPGHELSAVTYLTDEEELSSDEPEGESEGEGFNAHPSLEEQEAPYVGDEDAGNLEDYKPIGDGTIHDDLHSIYHAEDESPQLRSPTPEGARARSDELSDDFRISDDEIDIKTEYNY